MKDGSKKKEEEEESEGKWKISRFQYEVVVGRQTIGSSHEVSISEWGK